MPVPKTKPSEVVDLSKHRKQRFGSKLGPPATSPVALTDLPAVVVKTRRGRTVEIVNMPMRDAGADMVLTLIRQHPGSSLLTRDDDYVDLRDIAMVIDPKRGEIEVENARRSARDEAGPFRPIQVWLGTRRNERVGLVNIPDTEEGAALLRYILEEFRHDRQGAPTGYTLFTTDYGHIPVPELAKANPPPKRSSEDENPSR